jgi:putative transcriptional regulator
MGKKDKRDKKKKRRDEDTASSHEASGKLNLRSVDIPPRPKPMKPADIRALREELNASQALFARLLNVSSNAVESWEQGLRQPRQATLKLLYVARRNPEALLS